MGQNGIRVDPPEHPEGYDVWIVIDAESSGSGSTEEVLAELLDARIGHDGTTYDSVGSAIRTQISEIYRELSEYEVSTDHTLTVDGAPADAKSTGDTIRGVVESVSNTIGELRSVSLSRISMKLNSLKVITSRLSLTLLYLHGLRKRLNLSILQMKSVLCLRMERRRKK